MIASLPTERITSWIAALCGVAPCKAHTSPPEQHHKSTLGAWHPFLAKNGVRTWGGCAALSTAVSAALLRSDDLASRAAGGGSPMPHQQTGPRDDRLNLAKLTDNAR